MSHRLALAGLTVAAVVSFSVIAFNQARVPGAEYDADFPNEKPGPAPRRDLSGIWEPAREKLSHPVHDRTGVSTRRMPSSMRSKLDTSRSRCLAPAGVS